MCILFLALIVHIPASHSFEEDLHNGPMFGYATDDWQTTIKHAKIVIRSMTRLPAGSACTIKKDTLLHLIMTHEGTKHREVSVLATSPGLPVCPLLSRVVLTNNQWKAATDYAATRGK